MSGQLKSPANGNLPETRPLSPLGQEIFDLCTAMNKILYPPTDRSQTDVYSGKKSDSALLRTEK